MVTFIIVRHGETTYNQAKMMTGQANAPLTLKGKSQAIRAGKQLSKVDFDHVFSSPLDRAFETADIILKENKPFKSLGLKETFNTLAIRTTSNLYEQHTGDFTGRNHKKDPEIVSRKDGFDIPFPQGESMKDVLARVENFFNYAVLPILEPNKDEKILISCHANVIRALRIFFGESAPEDIGNKPFKKVPNATPWIIKLSDNGTVLDSFWLKDNEAFNGSKIIALPPKNSPPAAISLPKPKK